MCHKPPRLNNSAHIDIKSGALNVSWHQMDGPKADKLMHEPIILSMFKLFHSSLQRNMVSLNLSQNIKITKPGEVRFLSSSNESKNTTECVNCILHKDTRALFNYFDERIRLEEPLQVSGFDNYDKCMIIKRGETLVLIINISNNGIITAKTYCEQYNRLFFFNNTTFALMTLVITSHINSA